MRPISSLRRPLLPALLALLFVTSFVAPAGVAAELTLSDETERIGPQIALRHFVSLDENGWTDAQVLSVDLQDPGVDVDLVTAPKVADASPISQQAREAGAVAAVNGDFFDINNSNAADGWEIKSGTLRKSSQPNWRRVAAIGEDGVGLLTELVLDGTLGFDGGQQAVTGINISEGGTGSIVVYDHQWGDHSRARGTEGASPVREVIVADGVVSSVADTPGAGNLPEGTIALVGREAGAEALASLAPGDPVSFEYEIDGDFSSPLNFAVGGAAFLVEDGVVPESIPGEDGDAPRTAIGFDEDGQQLLLAIADGRQGEVVLGPTRLEMAHLMAELGAEDAMLLDGGGSTTLVARALGDSEPELRNTPSDGSERSDPNGVGIFLEPGDGVARELVVEPSGEEARVFPGLHRAVSAKAIDDRDAPVALDSDDVTWSAPAGAVSGRRYRAPADAEGLVRLRASSDTADGETTLDVLGPLQRLEASSERISLAETTSSPVTLWVTGEDAEGFAAPIDPTDMELSYDESVIEVSPEGEALRIAPKGSGGTILEIEVGEESIQVPVTVGFQTQQLSGFDTEGVWEFRNDRSPTGGISIVDEGHTGKGIRVDYDFTASTATRSAGVSAITPIELPGQPLRVSLWVNGDGQGQWLRAQVREISTNRSFNLDGDYITWTGWRRVTMEVPAGTQFPIQLENLRLIETSASRQYTGSFVFDDLDVDLPASIDEPADPPLEADRLIDSDGVLPSGGERFEFAALSDVQFTASNQELVPVAIQALRRIRAQSPDFVVLNGDIVDTGYEADIDLSRQVLEEGGCDLVAAGEEIPEPTADTVPCLYVPGNHEAYGTGNLDLWEEEFGEPYRAFDHDGVRFVLLNSSLGKLRTSDWDQLPMLQAAIEEAEGDPSINGLIVFAHHPTNDPDPADASQLGERKEVELIEKMLSDFRAESGKGAAMVGSHAQIVNVDRVDGVPYMVLPSSGKSPYGTPDRGGFTGWVRFGVDPGQDAAGDWLSADVRAFAQEVTIEAPDSIEVSESVPIGGEIVQPSGVSEGSREVPLRYPMSVRWSGSSELAIGGGEAAVREAREQGKIAILDPQAGMITGLRAGEVTVAVENDSMREGDDTSPVRAERTITVGAYTGPGPRLEATEPSFPEQAAGTIGSPVEVTVSNPGDSALSIDDIEIADADGISASDFIVSSDFCSGQQVDPGSSCRLVLRFAPSRADATSAAELVLSADTAERLHRVALTARSAASTEPEPDEPETDEPEPQGGGDGPQADVTGPETMLVFGPRSGQKVRKRGKTVSFWFISSESGSSFLCSVDAQAMRACDSPLKRKLKKGRHTFKVQAIDPAGNADPTPTSYGFTLKRRR